MEMFKFLDNFLMCFSYFVYNEFDFKLKLGLGEKLRFNYMEDDVLLQLLSIGK